MINLSIIIPTYKREASLVRLLASLSSQVDSHSEIIVVEQGENHKNTFIHSMHNTGTLFHYIFLDQITTSLAKNVGAKRAKGKYLLFLDDDVVAQPGLIVGHLNGYDDEVVAAVSGRVVTIGQKIEEYRADVGRITNFGTFTDGYSSTVRQEIDTVLGCNVSWRRDIFESLHGFDEQFTGNGMREESDLSLRAKKRGWKIMFEPNAPAMHMRETSGGARKVDDRMGWYFHFFSNETYFYFKHRALMLFPIFLLTRTEWFLRCMLGFGREVSMRSFLVPFRGVMHGIWKWRHTYDYWR